VVVHESHFVITGSEDGAIRMWNVEGREQTLQFLVVNQVCALSRGHIMGPMYNPVDMLAKLLVIFLIKKNPCGVLALIV